ncbi:MAG: hypothetical protein FWC69_00860 [Defluviitaleaceae bacterium]|nr:hypothetical protein [Defluviitaleaceae bacterium]
MMITRSENQLKSIKIPKSFIDHDDIRYLMYDLLNDFNYEEKQAIYFYCILDVSISDVAKAVQLSKEYVIIVLNLYLEKLNIKLSFFKSFMYYEEEDFLLIDEMLLSEQMY